MRIFPLLAALLLLLAAPARADFTTGLAAYDGGDYAMAFDEWLPLAQGGDAEAQIAVADLYTQGYGVPRNPAKAVHWYKRAALRGAVVAQINLGDMYARGLGVAQDLVKARARLRVAAQSGQEWAQKRFAALGQKMTPDQRAASLALSKKLLLKQ